MERRGEHLRGKSYYRQPEYGGNRGEHRGWDHDDGHRGGSDGHGRDVRRDLLSSLLAGEGSYRKENVWKRIRMI